MKSLFVLAVFVGQLFAQNCLITVPQGALTATGLATPYTQTGCTQACCTTSFAQGLILDTANSVLSVYNPLVIDAGTKPLVVPSVPTLPTSNVVALWFGTNGNTLTLVDNGGSLAGAQCVNGIINPMNNQLDIFGQFAYCNAIAFFVSAKNLVKAGTLVPPPLGTAIDGAPCPTTRDFFIVDQDQSDNVVTAYILSNGQVAQNTTTNFRNFPNSVILTNGSDNRLLVAVDQAIGCKPWAAPDASDLTNGQNVLLPASGLNELHADHWQQAPIAYVPLNDPMVKSNNQPSLTKVNAYRQGTGQPAAASGADADQVNYCFNIYTVQPLRLLKLMGSLINYPSLDAAMADSLYTFLGTRFVASFSDQNLDCFDLLQIPRSLPPIRLTLNGNGQTVGITITPPNNGNANPFYAATTGAVVEKVKAAAAPSSLWTTLLLIPVLVFLLL